MQQSAGRHPLPHSIEQTLGQLALLRSQRGRIPLLAVHVVDRHEGRLAAHGQADVAGTDFRVHLMAQRVDPPPLIRRVRQRNARVLRDPRHRHRMAEAHLAGVNGA
jgi:hypothetical protein